MSHILECKPLRIASNLTSVVLGENIKTIGKEAFYFCGNLTDVYITNIDNWCNIDFDGYSSNPLYYAKNLYINNELTSSIEISDNITELKKYAFNNYCSLNMYSNFSKCTKYWGKGIL